MKTAMQEFVNDTLNGSLKEMNYYFELEKKQIEDAFGNGEYIVWVKERLDYDHEDYNFSNSEEFYNYTYKSI